MGSWTITLYSEALILLLPPEICVLTLSSLVSYLSRAVH